MHHLQGSLFALGLSLAGPAAMVLGFRALRIKRLLDDTPTSRIRSMAMGVVELNGQVAERSRVAAPFSGRPCAYWEIEIQTRSANRRNNSLRSWSTVHRNRSGHPFFVRDASGVALVYPQGADVKMPFGVDEETHGFGVPDLYQQYMEAQGLGMRHLWALGPMRFRERVLEEGANVFVFGRAFPRSRALAVSQDEDELAATGTDGGAATRLREMDAQVSGVIRRGENDPAFVVSQRSEKTMAFEYGLRAFGGLVGGPVLALFGVWCLLELAKSGQLFR